MDPRRGHRPHPARGRRGDGPLHRHASCAAATSTYASTPAWSPASTAIAVLSDGSRFPTRTVVWTAGVKPHPAPRRHRPAAQRARTAAVHPVADRRRRRPRLGAPGDAAAVPDVTADEPGKETAPNAQHAVRQAKVLADNLARSLRGEPLQTVLPRLRRLGRLPRTAQGRRACLRAQAEGLPRLVHAPHVPPQPGAHLQPQGPRPRRMDPRRPLQDGRSSRSAPSNTRVRSSNSRPVGSPRRTPRATRRGRPDRSQELLRGGAGV